MPGEQLTCVWQVVYAQDQTKNSKLPKGQLKNFLTKTSKLESVDYSERVFEDKFKAPAVKFDQFKEYVRKNLREKGVPLLKVQNDLEEFSWEMLKVTIKSNMDEKDLYKLWRITNRLLKEDTYPPVIYRGDVCWLSEKMLSTIGNNLKSSDDAFKKESFTFQEMLAIIEDFTIANASKDQVRICLGDLYSWLVDEVMKTGKVYKRTKKQANWTNWVKRWCIVTPQEVSYFNTDVKPSSTDSRRKGEFMITKNTKVESLENYSGLIHNLHGRFRLSNIPVLEMEIAVGDVEEKRAWLSDIEEIIQCAKEHTTPVQKLLRERHEKSMTQSKDSGGKDVELALNQSKTKADRQSRMLTEEVKNKHMPPKQKSLEKSSRDKLKALFMKIDKNGNGLLDRDEFGNFLSSLGLNMSEKERNLVFKSVDTKNTGQITFEDFQQYFCTHIMNETETAECVNAMRKAFLAADRDGSGSLNFREFTEFVWEKNRSARMTKILKSFAHIESDEISFADFEKLVSGSASEILLPIIEEEIEEETDSSFNDFENRLQKVYDDTEAEELAKYIRERWNKFATFRRAGATGSVVMKGGHGMVEDIVPGEYSLIDLACFSDLPPLIPKHTVIKNVTWVSSTIPGKSGKAIFPPDFNRKIAVDTATSELLRYYECSFADAQQEKISLLFRHGIQDFTYENGYLDKYVTATNGGAGIEKHEFSHLDCPLSEDSGIFILAKFVDTGDLHITGFKLPVRHTLYVPGGIIHCNDYLKGTWRTMLSDETVIDHVHLTQMKDGQEQKFKFQFE